MPTLTQPTTPATNGTPRAETAAPPAPSAVSMSITVVKDRAALEQHVAAWNDLADHALEPNSYYEPWMLLPAIDAFGPGHDLRFLLVYRSNPARPQETPLLCGFFPLHRLRSFKGLPVSCLTLWEYGNCFLSTPLVHKDHATECLEALFDWLAADRESAALFNFAQMAGDGPVYHHLVDLFRARGTLSYIYDAHTRAFLRRRDSADAYLQEALSANKRRDLQRKQRRLMEFGPLDYVPLTEKDDIEAWIAAFMRLEASGWKGKEGTALACRQADPTYFKEMARLGFQSGRLWVQSLRLNGQPIALRWNFISKPGSFFYKPAYDEEYARYSPGVLLEMETIRQLHADPGLQWMDSCTDPDNGLLNAMWLDRRIIHSVVVATGRGAGRFVISALPLFRWVNRKLGRYKTSKA